MLKTARLFFAALLCCVVLVAVEYPKHTGGFVSDFANCIPADTETQLNAQLADYERATSIEIAVVTVKSLEGLSVEDYTQGLWGEWKVGKAGESNGLVFLVAPAERKVRIQTGYGIEPDLTDGRAGYLLDSAVLPRFKAGDIAGGIAAGVNGIIAELGEKPYNVRETERKALAVLLQSRQEEEARAIGFALSAMAAIGFFGWLISWFVRRKDRKVEILRARPRVEALLDEFRRELSDYASALASLKAIAPEAVWGQFHKILSNLHNQPTRLKAEIEQLQAREIPFWLMARTEMLEVLWAIEREIQGHRRFPLLVDSKIKAFNEARAASEQLLATLPDRVQRVGIQARTPGGQQYYQAAANSLARCRFQREGGEPVNWLAVHSTLTECSRQLRYAEHPSESLQWGGGGSGNQPPGNAGGGGGSFTFGGGESGGGGASRGW